MNIIYDPRGSMGGGAPTFIFVKKYKNARGGGTGQCQFFSGVGCHLSGES